MRAFRHLLRVYQRIPIKSIERLFAFLVSRMSILLAPRKDHIIFCKRVRSSEQQLYMIVPQNMGPQEAYPKSQTAGKL